MILFTKDGSSARLTGGVASLSRINFKLLKVDLKHWNKQVFGFMAENIESQRKENQRFDEIDDNTGPNDSKIVQRNVVSVSLLRDLKLHDNLLA